MSTLVENNMDCPEIVTFTKNYKIQLCLVLTERKPTQASRKIALLLQHHPPGTSPWNHMLYLHQTVLFPQQENAGKSILQENGWNQVIMLGEISETHQFHVLFLFLFVCLFVLLFISGK